MRQTKHVLPPSCLGDAAGWPLILWRGPRPVPSLNSKAWPGRSCRMVSRKTWPAAGSQTQEFKDGSGRCGGMVSTREAWPAAGSQYPKIQMSLAKLRDGHNWVAWPAAGLELSFSSTSVHIELVKFFSCGLFELCSEHLEACVFELRRLTIRTAFHPLRV